MQSKPLTEHYWRSSIDAYLETWIGRPMEEIHTSESSASAIMDFACDMQIQIAAANGLKDFTNSNVMYFKLRPGISVSIDRGLSCAARYVSFGVYLDEWFIESHICRPESLPYMKDDFWADISTISSIGKTTLEENVPICFPKDTPRRFVSTKKSIVFRLARNAIFKGLDKDGDQENIGILSTRFSLETPFPKLFDSLRTTYDLYYRCATRLLKHSLNAIEVAK